MKKISLKGLDQDVYLETLKNNLNIIMVPYTNKKNYFITYATRYGSNINAFIPVGSKKGITVPNGIAHFLEHKMFEQADGVDPFTFFAESGTGANASTSYTSTQYICYGTKEFAKNLDFLLKFVNEPYFTDENVLKEKGIIKEEIKMYDDIPESVLENKLKENLYHIDPHRIDIAGSCSDIDKITKEDLYTCYYTFYHPSNMFLVITGNVDSKDIMCLIKANQEKKTFKPYKEIVLKDYDEPYEVQTKKGRAQMDIEIPKVSVGYKIRNNSSIDINKFKTYIGMFFDIKFGSVSEFNEKIKLQNLTTMDLDITLVNTDRHVLVIISAETNQSKILLEKIEEELKSTKISETDFNRKKKVKKSSVIYKSDSIYALNNKIMANIINYGKVITDEPAFIDELNYKELFNILKNVDFSNKTIYELNKTQKD